MEFLNKKLSKEELTAQHRKIYGEYLKEPEGRKKDYLKGAADFICHLLDDTALKLDFLEEIQ